MKTVIAATLAGLLFGLGLHVSGMSNPAKVLNFLDFAGNWDASLLLVMGGAVAATAIGYRIVWARGKPWLDRQFYLPSQIALDPQLIIGATLFGLGWGLVGICPGPALSALLTGLWPIWLFTVAMTIGMAAVPMAQRALGLAAA